MPLATHLVEVFEWPNTILNTSELDFGKGEYQPTQLSTKEDLIKNWMTVTRPEKQPWKKQQKTT